MKNSENGLKIYFEKLLSFLRVRSAAAGLEVNDQVLRLIRFDGKTWHQDAVRLEPGILEGGKIKNKEAFIAALAVLRLKVLKKSQKGRKLNVVLVLSSLSIYTQIFNLPIVEGENLEKAIELNVQMLSPVDISQVYSGWQMAGRDEVESRFEVLAAFADKAIIDEMTQTLLDAGFISVAIESKALALARVLREQGSGVDVTKKYLFVGIDNSGMDFLVIRDGQLYFEYSHQWKDIMDEKGQIPIESFKATLSASLRQVSNFYTQHWGDPIAGVVLSAAAFQAQVEEIAAAVLNLPMILLTSPAVPPVAVEWMVALGAGLRGFAARGKDKQISLLGEGAEETFRREQIKGFNSFWRVLVPVTLGLLVLVFGASDIFLSHTRSTLEMQSTFNLQSTQTDQISVLEASSTDFNESVAMIQSIENLQKQQTQTHQIVGEVMDLAGANNITVNNLSYQGAGSQIYLNGSGPTQDAVVAFKDAIQNDPLFGTVNLPLTAIQSNGESATFSMTFPLK